VEFLFADYVLDADRRELRRGAERVVVEPQVLDLLIHLLNNRNRVVSKDDLIATVWGGRIVSDGTLISRTYAARKAIGDTGQDQRLIRTIPRKGLRFVGEVHTRANDAGDIAAVWASTENIPPPSRASDRPAIAVLPFTNMSDDPEQGYFSDGITEDIIAALCRLRWFQVIARNSSFIYKGKAVHLKQVAADLGVGYVLEGSVRKVGHRVRITAQLNDVSTGSHIWAERYDRSIDDVFAVQDEITEAIVASIEPQLYAAESFHAQRKPPDNLGAWELVMRALSHFWRVTQEDNAIAQTLLEKAIAIDPHYGQALGVLAASQTLGAYMGWADMLSAVQAAEHAALAAIEADSEDPWAHHALGCAYLLTRRFDESLAELAAALRLNPNFALAQAIQGLTLAFCGRWQEADEAARRALRLSPRDPLSALYYGVASYAQFVGRNYEAALQLAQTAVRLRSDYVGALRLLAASAAMAGQRETAASALQELRRAQPNVSLAWIASQMPMRLPAEREHYLEAFRRAGLE
jgi:TolB-like protein/cytochrome c-type biogenesis protein CcmH/NrfG